MGCVRMQTTGSEVGGSDEEGRREKGEGRKEKGEGREEGKVKEEGKPVLVMEQRIDEDNASESDGFIRVAGVS